MASGVTMSEIFVVCNNLLDISKIRESLKGEQVSIFRDHIKLCGAISKEINEEIEIILDYYTYEKIGIKNVVSDLERALGDTNSSIKYTSFVPHEKLSQLKIDAPNINFIARSKYFSFLNSE